MKRSALVLGGVAGLAVVFTTAHQVRRNAAERAASNVAAAAQDIGAARPEVSAPARRVHPATAAPAPESRLVVAFRLDPDITRGLYLGDRWVSPPSFAFAQPGNRYVVHARMQTVDPGGERTDVSGDWSTSDPDMIGITRGKGGEVLIEVDQPGQATLRVAAGGEAKVLQVHARRIADAMEVDFRQ